MAHELFNSVSHIEIQHTQKVRAHDIPPYYVIYCLWSSQLVRGTEQTT